MSTTYDTERVEVRALALGHLDPFSSISGLIELNSDEVLIADAVERRLLKVDLKSADAIELGSHGRGPREYLRPTRPFPFAGDSVLLEDVPNGRLAVVSPESGIGRTIAMPGWARTLPIGGSDTLGHVYFETRTYQVTPNGVDVESDSVAIVKWSIRAGTFDTVAKIKKPGIVVEEVQESGAGGARVSNIVLEQPFSPADTWIPLRSGGVHIVRSDPFRLERWGKDGRERVSPEFRTRPIRVTRNDRESHPSFDLAIDLTWPEFKTPFPTNGLRPAPDGSPAWLQLHTASEVSREEYLAVGWEGAKYTVLLPQGEELVGIGRGRIYTSREDKVGLKHLGALELVRTGRQDPG